jgi:hypothetical protein
MGNICLIIPENVLQGLNLGSFVIISYPARYEIGDLFEFK